MKSNQLARQVAQEISRRILARDFEPGQHISAQTVANDFGISRSPVREALQLLLDAGLVVQKPNRGFFVTDSQQQLERSNALSAALEDEQSDYQQIADDWRRDALPEEVTEQYLRNRYGITKARLNDLLVRAVREGWAERKPGYGWRFLTVAKTPEAFEKIYHFRMVIEPAAMLDPDYEIDLQMLANLKRIQMRMLDHDIEHQPLERLLSVGAGFHEELIKFSGNPYFHQSLVRVNQMRRLLEYRTVFNRERFVEQTQGHLAIIELLERGEVIEASYNMRRHLSGALKKKSPLLWSQEDANLGKI
ncbi:GntR family transcriptional regulator [Denitrobaculum tricleocarpae]|uniref:GntR family transcriptional regulator n=1 Tax=Denitrobaculum tricleocarpae TaxID=2591009 RepID=A0A545TMW3_9PROT|nr:GntR family transcriptional regulator [Denitrobaculum tricleocarpae]TQV78572.1 GntR family transcriptional regulator [Denitrobaculum tricleocarpae]